MTDTTMAYIASVLIAGSVAMWLRALRTVAIPHNRIVYIVVWTAGAAAALSALFGSPGWLGGTLAVISLVSAALLLLTVFIGGQKLGDDVIRVGMTIPAFSAPDETGQAFDSAALTGNPALIKFFRGHW